MKATIQLRPLFHRNAECIGVFFEINIRINTALRKTNIARYSHTHRCWYALLNKENYSTLVKTLKPFAEVDSSALSAYLNQKNKNPQVATQYTHSFTVPVSATVVAIPVTQYRIDPVNEDVLPQMQTQLKLRAYSPSTIRTYVNEMRQFLIALKSTAADSLPQHRLKDYLVYCYEKLQLKENTLHSRINALKFYYEQVLHREKFFWDIPRPKRQLQLPSFFNQDEIAAILNAVKNLKQKAMLMLAYSSGLRVSEVVKIRTKDIDSKRMCILIHQAKGKKDRIVSLSPVLLILLREYAKSYNPDKNGYLFSGQYKGDPYSSRSLQLVLAGAKKNAGITKTGSIHALRHSFATHLLDKGTDVTIIMKLLGHNDLKTTLRYLHTSNRDLLQIISPLDHLKLD